MASKYDELSGKNVLTTTSFGLLTDILVYTDVELYLDKQGSYSLDKITWCELNKGLYKQLLEMSNYLENIKVVG